MATPIIYIDASKPEDWDRAIKALEAAADEPDEVDERLAYTLHEKPRSAPLRSPWNRRRR